MRESYLAVNNLPKTLFFGHNALCVFTTMTVKLLAFTCWYCLGEEHVAPSGSECRLESASERLPM